MRLSSGALDMIATDLSKFTSPDIPELSLKDDKTLQNNMLAGVLGVFSGETNAYVRHIMTNIVRRVYAAIETYELGRRHALDYVEGDRRWRISPYFLALTNFDRSGQENGGIPEQDRAQPHCAKLEGERHRG